MGIWLIFCTPPDDDVAGAAHHRLGGEVDGLLGGATLAVDRRSRHLVGEAGDEPAGAGNVARLRSDGVDAAEDDIFDGVRIDA